MHSLVVHLNGIMGEGMSPLVLEIELLGVLGGVGQVNERA